MIAIERDNSLWVSMQSLSEPNVVWHQLSQRPGNHVTAIDIVYLFFYQGGYTELDVNRKISCQLRARLKSTPCDSEHKP